MAIKKKWHLRKKIGDNNKGGIIEKVKNMNRETHADSQRQFSIIKGQKIKER